jgi:hypothetical protein
MDKLITNGDKYNPAMKLTDEQEAKEYFDLCVQHCMSFGKTLEEAESIERQNLGYWAGYYDNETRERVERLFGAEHPIFGSVSNVITAEKAFELGKNLVK